MKFRITCPGLYKTRDGKKAEVAYVSKYNKTHPMVGGVGDAVEIWQVTGQHGLDDESNLDIVAKWEEPVSGETVNLLEQTETNITNFLLKNMDSWDRAFGMIPTSITIPSKLFKSFKDAVQDRGRYKAESADGGALTLHYRSGSINIVSEAPTILQELQDRTKAATEYFKKEEQSMHPNLNPEYVEAVIRKETDVQQTKISEYNLKLVPLKRKVVTKVWVMEFSNGMYTTVRSEQPPKLNNTNDYIYFTECLGAIEGSEEITEGAV